MAENFKNVVYDIFQLINTCNSELVIEGWR